ncbi:PIN domain-containing protein [candidate division KSB1 bacterium]|nr:PIN domain-containing protein [candidate division KSB1 bacterium]
MKVIVDTCIWSLALRRKRVEPNDYLLELEKLVKSYRVQMIGPIRQEILSGIRNPRVFVTLKKHLAMFVDLPIVTIDYETAAEFGNIVRQRGIQGSAIDFLICAVSVRHKMPIFTIDTDFSNFQPYIPITLHEI